ncbi:MAG TPA: hypothetical protein VH414_13270 [Lichenihabitans sp.]|nr:hypothetical protein [Lichenihabitans sp.]
MSVIDLDAVRAKLVADRRLAEKAVERLAEFLVSESIRQAERACAVAAPIAAADEPMSRIIHRGVVRRLRADVRKAFAGTGDEMREWALEKAIEIYRARSIVILDERDRRRSEGQGA